MSVGANPTGIAPRVAPPPAKVQAPNTGSEGPRANAMKNANAPANTPAPTAVASSAAPVSAPVGGTTSPAAAGPRAQAQTVTGQMQGAVAVSNAMSISAPFLAVATQVVGSRSRKVSQAGDAKEDTGDVGLETESEMQPDALQETDQEQGAGEITEAGSMSGPST